jgi:hypothetical protein
MPGLFLVNVLDASRSLGPRPLQATAGSVAEWLRANYVPVAAGGFNYDPSINTTYDLFRGSHTLESAVAHCLTTGNPKGREQNAAAIRKIAPFALANISTCYRIGNSAVAVGRVAGATIYIGIKTPMVRVRHDEAYVVMPGYRMSFRPSDAEIDTACSIALANFARDDYARADFEYLYAGPGEGGARQFRAYHGRHRQVYHRDTVDALMDVYVKGVAIVLNAGLGQSRPDMRGYKIIDPRAPTFL